MADLPLTIMPKLLTYHELVKRENWGDRLDYLKLWDKPHTSPRAISNSFYKSRWWMLARKEVLLRDLRCDLGVVGMFINDTVIQRVVWKDGKKVLVKVPVQGIIIHHMNPLQPEDFDNWTDDMVDPEYLITVSYQTHNQIHYKTIEPLPERRPGDTKLW